MSNCEIWKFNRIVHLRTLCPILLGYCSQMLYLSGCDMNAVHIWIETSSGGSVFMLPVKNGEMKEWLKVTTSNPSSLKQKCRYGTNFGTFVYFLNLESF